MEPVDIPLDFKIEHDRLVNEIEPRAERLAQILREVPRGPCTEETIEYNNCKVAIIIGEEYNFSEIHAKHQLKEEYDGIVSQIKWRNNRAEFHANKIEEIPSWDEWLESIK